MADAQSLSFRLDQSKVKLIIPVGRSKAGTIKAYSQSNDSINLKVYLEDWAYTAEQDGSKEFFPAGSRPFSCAEWIKFYPAEFTLAPYGTATINYVVNVPVNASGGHFAVMFFETTAQQLSAQDIPGGEGVTSGVGLAIRMGSLFYIEAKDTVKRTVELSNFYVDNEVKNNYLSVGLNLKNTGNTYITANGSFHIMDKEGLIYARNEFNEVYTFPGDTATLNATWKKTIPKGKYSLVITLDLGKAQEEAGLSRGPVLVKEAGLEIGFNGNVLRVGDLK